MNVWKQFVDPKILGKYIAAIKQGKTGNECAFSLLLMVGLANDYHFPNQKFFDECQPLIDTYETNHNWNDVLEHILK
jgi:hypothetical protein